VSDFRIDLTFVKLCLHDTASCTTGCIVHTGYYIGICMFCSHVAAIIKLSEYRYLLPASHCELWSKYIYRIFFDFRSFQS